MPEDVIRIIDFVTESTSMLENVPPFEDVVIQGPAILVPLDNYVFEQCTFEGTFESLFREVPEGTILVGVIGLRDVVFRRCRFRNVGFVGTAETIQRFGRDVLR